jgi:hypothetical protein
MLKCSFNKICLFIRDIPLILSYYFYLINSFFTNNGNSVNIKNIFLLKKYIHNKHSLAE